MRWLAVTFKNKSLTIKFPSSLPSSVVWKNFFKEAFLVDFIYKNWFYNLTASGIYSGILLVNQLMLNKVLLRFYLIIDITLLPLIGGMSLDFIKPLLLSTLLLVSVALGAFSFYILIW